MAFTLRERGYRDGFWGREPQEADEDYLEGWEVGARRGDRTRTRDVEEPAESREPRGAGAVSAHIQYELDALNAATAISTVAKIGRQWVVSGLADMWAHCFRSRTEEVNDILLAGFFSEPIGSVLEGFGFLERIADGRWRVKGMGRYVSLSQKRKAAGSKGGKATQASSKNTTKPASDAGSAEAKPSKDGFAQAKVEHDSSNRQANGQANPENGVANQALKPITNISLPSGERDITRVEPSEGVGAQPALGGAGSPTQAAPVERPERPPDPGEPPEVFLRRYPWPANTREQVHAHAMQTLSRYCMATKQRVRDLREALTRERHGDRTEVDVMPDERPLAVVR